MPLLLYDFTDVVAFGADHSTVARTVAEAAAIDGRRLSRPTRCRSESIFARSDHYRFVLRGVPAILLMTGYANGGEAALGQMAADDLSQPAGRFAQPINWSAGARYAELNYRISRALADADQPAAVVRRRLFRRRVRAGAAAGRSADLDLSGPSP